MWLQTTGNAGEYGSIIKVGKGDPDTEAFDY